MRPVFLVVDPPDPESLSTRKLVLESAMFNVLTAFSMREAQEILDHHPVQAAVFHERAFGTSDAEEIVRRVKKKIPNVPIIVLSPYPGGIRGADHVISSHDPIELVRILQDKFGIHDPAQIEPEPLHREQ